MHAVNIADPQIQPFQGFVKSPSQKSIKSEDDSPQKQRNLSPSKKMRASSNNYRSQIFLSFDDPKIDPRENIGNMLL
jgi:hypothetical protein